MSNFTKKEIKKYLNNPNNCPKCGEQVKVDEEFVEEGSGGYRIIICKNDDCSTKFYESYELTTIEKID